MRHFVLPGIHTLARANGRALTDADIKPRDKQIRPSTKCKYVEAGMLYALVSSVLKKGDPVREVALGMCREVGVGNDAQFVYECDLGGRGVANRVYGLGEGYEGVEGADVLHSFISNSVKELKRRTRKKRVAIYPGRDVWCWEVMSRRLGMPSHYDSRVSRSIATNPKAIKKAIEPWNIKDWESTVLFDTGHQGTVPRAIGRAAGLDKMLVIMLSAVNNSEQIFRTHSKSRKKALACEYLAKYRRRAIVRDDAPYQELADLDEFIKAALLTIWLWHHISPSRLPSWKDEPAVPTFKKKKDTGLNITSGGTSLTVNPQATLTFAGGTTTTGPIWVDTTSAATTITGGGINWAPMTGGWGNTGSTSGNAWLDPNTFNIVDPIQQQIQDFKQQQIQAFRHKMIDQSNFGVANILDNSPSQLNRNSGGPSGGSAPNPTTGQGQASSAPIPPVTDGNGKAITT